MPKNRKRVSKAAGAKSVPVLTKFKLGGRKSSTGAERLSNSEAQEMLTKVRKRDRNKLRQILTNRGIAND